MQNVPFYIDIRTWLAPGLHGAAVNQMQIQIEKVYETPLNRRKFAHLLRRYTFLLLDKKYA